MGQGISDYPLYKSESVSQPMPLLLPASRSIPPSRIPIKISLQGKKRNDMKTVFTAPKKHEKQGKQMK